jgi:hypothetical protein
VAICDQIDESPILADPRIWVRDEESCTFYVINVIAFSASQLYEDDGFADLRYWRLGQLLLMCSRLLGSWRLLRGLGFTCRDGEQNQEKQFSAIHQLSPSALRTHYFRILATGINLLP